MTAADAPKLFVSYRRVGTAIHAGRLYDAMAARFGERNVFMDLEMAPGVDFVERITTAVGSCRALLVVIGPEWAGDGDGGSRLADPGDFVRLEVETALRTGGVTVIPVLVAGAHMPAPEQLPPQLRPLARRNAIELSDLRWRFDCQRLLAALDELLDAPAAVADEPAGPAVATARAAPPPKAARALAPLWLEGVAVAVAAGLLARWLGDSLKVPRTAPDRDQIRSAIELRALVWAVVAATLAVWLGVRRGDRGRLLRRTATGLLLGALAGALGGALWGLICYLPRHNLGDDARNQVQIAGLALTGGIVGLAIGWSWIPPRAALGCLGGALGGAGVQVATNLTHHPPEVWAFGLNCLAVVGVTLLGLLAADVRAAAAAPQPALVPDAAEV